ncbi:MAG: FtsW/RodA/SpoVE family cell cycle protein [candidate division WOR-3 bacterium]|nr:FtsW/RodA/SpoVE family cell cycle protein [candidate division WOR-3 bacterium]
MNFPKAQTPPIISPLKPTSAIDAWILIVTLILIMIGLISVYSVTMNSGTGYLKNQAIRIIIGLGAMVVGFAIPYKLYEGKTKDVLLIITIILLIITLTFGRKVAFARRWAFFFQTAEFAKYSLIIWLSGYFANLKEKQKKIELKKNLIKTFPYSPLIVVVVVIGLLLLQPAIGTSFILAISSLCLFFIAGVRPRHIFLISSISIALLVISILTIPYAKSRFEKFWQGIPYQQRQSRIAIGSGGITGVGLGEGKQKLHFLPKAHTDFIFSAFAEETGLIGSLIMLTLFFILFARGFKIGIQTNDFFGQYLTIGISIIIFLYVLVHLAVALKLLPTTGQPLPFVSYGGSALISNLYAVGIILNVSKYRRNTYENGFHYHRRYRWSYLSQYRPR